MHKLRFRQVHLDFHTSEDIENVGSQFDKKQFQSALTKGHVDSVTCFAKCHHGWSYHATRVGRQHPHLNFDLLRAQYEAAREIDVNVPIYLSAGCDNMISKQHMEWREIDTDGNSVPGSSEPGFHKMCFNSPYTEYLCRQIREVVELFSHADGIFLDIVYQGQCCCEWCLALMKSKGLDANKESDRTVCAQIALDRYYEVTTSACKSLRDDMPVFHNSGHIQRGDRRRLKYFSHLELESLPTGGWGYDHFPVSAKYCQNLRYDFLGMTGKFHTTWGEFGGYKHPNALKYECSAMLAYGAKCSIGDQLHPEGEMDKSTYQIIGSAYQEVKAKEPWCEDVENVADIGLLSAAAVDAVEWTGKQDEAADMGAARVLLEGHFLFDVVDCEMDFSKYRVLMLPDNISVSDDLKGKLDEYLSKGGKLFLTGTSGLNADGSGFMFDAGATWHGQSEYTPDYVLANEEFQPSFVGSPLVMYLRSQRIKSVDGESLGKIYDPYFNRTSKHFCSHQHAPARPEPSGFDCGVHKKNILYLAHPVFSIYGAIGAVAYKEYIINTVNYLLGQPTVEVDLPSTGRITLMQQKRHGRFVLHLLYVNLVNRGGTVDVSGGTASDKSKSVEVVDELSLLREVKLSVLVPEKIESVTSVPNRDELTFVQKDGRVKFVLPRLLCHHMVELRYQVT